VKRILNKVWKKCGKEHFEKSVKKMWKAIMGKLWKNCEKK
jgi:hypothetical protein